MLCEIKKLFVSLLGNIGSEVCEKSANTCDLRAVRGWKVMSYSLSSTVHLVSLPESSGLWSMLFKG